MQLSLSTYCMQNLCKRQQTCSMRNINSIARVQSPDVRCESRFPHYTWASLTTIAGASLLTYITAQYPTWIHHTASRPHVQRQHHAHDNGNLQSTHFPPGSQMHMRIYATGLASAFIRLHAAISHGFRTVIRKESGRQTFLRVLLFEWTFIRTDVCSNGHFWSEYLFKW